MSLPKITDNTSALPTRQVKATRRQFLSGAAALAASRSEIPACSDTVNDPIIALISEEKCRRLLAVAVRARAEKFVFALPRNEWPDEFDDHPIMVEALSLEQCADEVYERIIQTPACTLAGICAKLEWGEGDTEATEAVIADLRRWLSARS